MDKGEVLTAGKAILDELGSVVKEIVQTFIPRSAMLDAWMTALG